MNYRALAAFGLSMALVSAPARAQDDEAESEDSAKAGEATKADGSVGVKASADTSAKTEASASAQGKATEPAATEPPATATPTGEADARPAERAPVYGKRTDWSIQPYGYARLDAIEDSTQSFEDGIQPNLIARVGTYRGDHRRTIFTARDSRLGLFIGAPTFGSVKSSAGTTPQP